jgi:hypothetical protein
MTTVLALGHGKKCSTRSFKIGGTPRCEAVSHDTAMGRPNTLGERP